MRPMAAAGIGALVAGLGVYAVGARASQDAWAEMPALVQTVDGRFIQVPHAKAVGYAPGYTAGYASALQPAAQPVVLGQSEPVVYRRPVPTRTVARGTEPVQTRVVERAEPRRSLMKTAMIIGGSSAAGAGVGGVMGGKKGALVGAAIGGGAASIYEATRRR